MAETNSLHHLSRREFGALAGAAALSSGVAPGFARLALADESAAQIIQGKSPEMIVLNAQLGVMETPLTLLRKYEHTPKEILFNRLHFAPDGAASWQATTAVPERKDWTLRIDGWCSGRATSASPTSPRWTRSSASRCSSAPATGRSFYAAKQKVAGGQWKHGGMGNVAWEGVPLRQFLADMKLEPAASVRWLTAEGWDEPPTPEGSDFAKSYDFGDPALDHAIIALKMNGEPIPAIHGGPVRLVIPASTAT
jgi:DMSO/TMAO reductase YedYZ molybdopterin-dependent catalytic subunit